MLANTDSQNEDIAYIKNRVLRKFPLLGVTMASLKNVADDKIGTAGTDGHIVYYSPKFFSTLSEDEKTCVYAHEVMHVAFNHILRSKDRNPRLWNIATDSVINQMLKNADLPIVEGGVDMAEAVNHSAEEMYEKLLKEREQKQQEQQNKDNAQNNQQKQQDQGDQQQQDQQQSPSEQQQQQEQPEQEKQEEGDKGQGDQEQSEQKQDQEQSDSQQGSGQGNPSDDEDENEQVGHDNHQIWKKAIEEAEKEQQRRQQEQSGEARRKSLLDRIRDLLASKEEQDQTNPPPPSPQTSVTGGNQQRQKGDDSSFEKSFSAKNEEERQHIIEQVRRNLEQQKNENMKAMSDSGGYSYGDLGAAKPVLDWKKMLKKSIEEEEDRWSYRRSGADNDFMARVEELEDENKSETEVMLDVSGSVNEQMLKEFLRQLKPILKTSKLKVGCFDHRIFNFKEIKNNKDIDDFVIRGGGGTDIDLAVRAFSKNKDVNKIVFTDGYSDSMPRQDLKKTNVIWLIYDNDDFRPACGKVIYVDKAQIRQNYMNNTLPQRGGR